jgi:acetyl-CoA acyltransferase
VESIDAKHTHRRQAMRAPDRRHAVPGAAAQAAGCSALAPEPTFHLMAVLPDARRVAIIAGVRTPFAKAGSALRHLGAIELGKMAVSELVHRSGVDPATIDLLAFGTVVPNVLAPNIAREVALMPLFPKNIQAWSVSRACASANQAITDAADQIALGHAHVAIAGGAESLSNVPILHSRAFSDVLLATAKAKSVGQRLRALSRLRPRDFVPVTPAIAEPTTGETMGESAEKMAKLNGIARAVQDELALASHRNAAAGTADGRLTAEIAPAYIPPRYDQTLVSDNGIRTDTDIEQLARLRPVFDRRYGSVTAGNSSPLTDGGAAVLLMSAERAAALGHRPLAYIRSYAYAAIDPGEQLLQAPVLAAPVALRRAGLSLKDIDLVEMHEAFAAQVLSNLQGFESTYWAERAGFSAPVGAVDRARLNVMGGSIALGHPFGATGARITTTLVNELARRGGQFGLMTVCAAGGLGFAMVVERT